ncbi:unnamed protein product [Ectocarpus sp. CCAP 1310/34]|nr:unnamed protein product [Ectocarpus sp. CCAP 1310/34]
MSAGVPVDYDVWKDWNESNQIFWANALDCFSRAWSRLTKREGDQEEQAAAATMIAGISTGTMPSTPLETNKGGVDGRTEGDE